MNKAAEESEPTGAPESVAPEDWPFRDEFANILSFQQILGTRQGVPDETDLPEVPDQEEARNEDDDQPR